MVGVVVTETVERIGGVMWCRVEVMSLGCELDEVWRDEDDDEDKVEDFWRLTGDDAEEDEVGELFEEWRTDVSFGLEDMEETGSA